MQMIPIMTWAHTHSTHHSRFLRLPSCIHSRTLIQKMPKFLFSMHQKKVADSCSCCTFCTHAHSLDAREQKMNEGYNHPQFLLIFNLKRQMKRNRMQCAFEKHGEKWGSMQKIQTTRQQCNNTILGSLCRKQCYCSACLLFSTECCRSLPFVFVRGRSIDVNLIPCWKSGWNVKRVRCNFAIINLLPLHCASLLRLPLNFGCRCRHRCYLAKMLLWPLLHYAILVYVFGVRSLSVCARARCMHPIRIHNPIPMPLLWNC